jgi:hypothetical protein
MENQDNKFAKKSSSGLINLNEIENKDGSSEKNFFVELENKMKYKANLFNKNKGEILLCLSVDGSESSDHAFDIFKDYLKEYKSNFKMFVMHVFNEQLDDKYNYRNKKKTVVSNYEIKTSELSSDQCLLYYENRSSKVHALEQVCLKAYEYNADYIISGYYGIKGPRGSSQELSKGIDYLLQCCKLPTIIIKEPYMRNKNQGKGFKWLFVLDRTYISCNRILSTFFPLVDREVDFIYALSLIPANSNNNLNDVQNAVNEEMEKHKFTNFKYEAIEFKSNPSDIVVRMINFGIQFTFDFVVIYNNPQKHKIEGEESVTLKIVKNSLCNICFMNGAA